MAQTATDETARPATRQPGEPRPSGTRCRRGAAAVLGAVVLMLGITACGGTDDGATDDASGSDADADGGEEAFDGDDEGTCTALGDAAGEALDVELVARAPFTDASATGVALDQDRGFVCSFEDPAGEVHASVSVLHWRDDEAYEAEAAQAEEQPELYRPFEPTGGGDSAHTVLLEGDVDAAVVLFRDGWQWALQVEALDPEADPADRPAEAALQEAIVALAETVDPDDLDLEEVEQPDEPEASDEDGGSEDDGSDGDEG